ncbi:MAG: pseudaminic acid synthase [Alphaproteobacteria bacterium]|nr:pseudaminic acid synthase [Alphaproteobacteria bacterium]
MKNIVINGRIIGKGQTPYVVAELSANHNGSLQQALDTISEAKARGADAIKLQTYTADTMTVDCEAEDFMIRGGLWNGYKLFDLYKEAQTPFEWHKEIFDHAIDVEITCFSTPFDETAVDLLEDLNSPAYKIASFEATDLPLIKYVASTKKPMIMSTGMANLDEIEEMVQAARDGGCDEMIILHCISSYPAPTDQSNLFTIPDLRKRLGVHVGLSDHTITNTASTVATALGAVLIEKHFILNRSDNGPDSTFSIEPHELETLVNAIKEASLSLGKAGYDRKPAEEENKKFRRSLYFVKDMEKGEIITEESVRRIRPGFGLPPKYFDLIIEKPVTRNIKRYSPVREVDIGIKKLKSNARKELKK